jgi:hypothetical protein
MRFINILSLSLLVILLGSCVIHRDPGDISQGDVPSFGTVGEITYAKLIWSVMEAERLIGENEIKQEPFFGGAKPHGMVLELAYKTVTANSHDGFIVVKKNYDGMGVTVESVKRNRSRYLSSITIMYQRESGYDTDNSDWFWAKYHPDGSLYQKKVEGKIMQMAGRIWKGKTMEQNRGCLYCHASAGGGDYIFYPEIKLPGEKP